MYSDEEEDIYEDNENSYQAETQLIVKAKEAGFTGDKTNWFNDDEFYKAGCTKYQDNDYYFSSYSGFYIHEEMISDSIRTESYRLAIENNKEAFKNKVRV
jgi:hypothetical protein